MFVELCILGCFTCFTSPLAFCTSHDALFCIDGEAFNLAFDFDLCSSALSTLDFFVSLYTQTQELRGRHFVCVVFWAAVVDALSSRLSPTRALQVFSQRIQEVTQNIGNQQYTTILFLCLACANHWNVQRMAEIPTQCKQD